MFIKTIPRFLSAGFTVSVWCARLSLLREDDCDGVRLEVLFLQNVGRWSAISCLVLSI